MGFPRQEYWSGLPFPSTGDLANPVIKLAFPAWQVNSLLLSNLGSLQWSKICLPMQETQETRVQSLDQEDTLEEEMVIIPVFLPGKSHGQSSLAGYSPWG